jgi:hypothetical protein
MKNIKNYPSLVCEALTLLFLLVIYLLWAGRPMLEGWAHLLNFQQGGIQASISITARALEQLPIGIGWLLGNGTVCGLVAAFTLITLSKYFAARWAIHPLIKGPFLWVLATLAVIILPWDEQWYAHNLSAQFASLCLFITLGACIRLRHHFSLKYFLIALFSFIISLLTYEALMLCALLIPITIIFSDDQPLRFKKPLFFRTLTPVILGLIIYLMFYFWTQSYNAGMTYHEQLLSGPQPIKYPFKLIAYLYYTTYFHSAWTYPFLMLFVLALIGPVILTQTNSKRLNLQLFTLGSILLLLPLVSLIYAVNFYFLSDLERACLPVGFAFFLFSFTSVARFSPHSDEAHYAISFVLVTALLIGTMINAYTAYQPYRLQRSVLNQIEPILKKNKAQSVLVRDWTGRLGDRYTFQYASTLGNALVLEGVSMPVNQLYLCTPDEVDRIHPMMEKIEGHTQIPHCSKLTIETNPTFVIDVRNTNNPLKPVIIPHGFESGVITNIAQGSIGGEEIRDNTNFYWINEKNGTISLENKTNKTINVTWKAQFTPSPCNINTQVKILVDDQSFLFPTDSQYHSFNTSIEAKQTKNIPFQIIGSVCQYGNPPGNFYTGILGMMVTPLQ